MYCQLVVQLDKLSGLREILQQYKYVVANDPTPFIPLFKVLLEPSTKETVHYSPDQMIEMALLNTFAQSSQSTILRIAHCF